MRDQTGTGLKGAGRGTGSGLRTDASHRKTSRSAVPSTYWYVLSIEKLELAFAVTFIVGRSTLQLETGIKIRMMDYENQNADDGDEIDVGGGGGDISAAPSLYLRPVHFRSTRKRGKILKTVTERYLRDDLGLGCHYVDDDASKRRVSEESFVLFVVTV